MRGVIISFAIVLLSLSTKLDASPKWRSSSSSDSVEIEPNIHIVGSDLPETMVIVGFMDLVLSVVNSDQQETFFHRTRNYWLQLDATLIDGKSSVCKEYFFGVSPDSPEFEFGVISDEIDGERHLFIVVGSIRGCPPSVSGNVRTYAMRNLSVHRDGASDVMIFDTKSKEIRLTRAE
jgi:hypothetical protein